MKLLLVGVAMAGCLSSAPPVRATITPPQIGITDPGAEPRRVVTFDIPLHHPEHVEAFVDLTTHVGDQQRIQYPTVRMLATYEALDRAIDGTERISFQVDRATYDGEISDPKIRSQFEGRMERLRHYHTTYRMTPYGVITHDPLPPGEKPDLDETLEALDAGGVVFPGQPIGVGATWAVSQTASIGNVEFHRKMTFHLRALDDASATVDIETEQNAPRQTIAAEPNASVELLSAHAAGRSYGLYPLRGLAATGGSHTASDIYLSLVDHGFMVKVGSQSVTELKVRPAAPDAR